MQKVCRTERTSRTRLSFFSPLSLSLFSYYFFSTLPPESLSSRALLSVSRTHTHTTGSSKAQTHACMHGYFYTRTHVKSKSRERKFQELTSYPSTSLSHSPSVLFAHQGIQGYYKTKQNIHRDKNRNRKNSASFFFFSASLVSAGTRFFLSGGGGRERYKIKICPHVTARRDRQEKPTWRVAEESGVAKT